MPSAASADSRELEKAKHLVLKAAFFPGLGIAEKGHCAFTARRLNFADALPPKKLCPMVYARALLRRCTEQLPADEARLNADRDCDNLLLPPPSRIRCVIEAEHLL